MVVKSAYRDFSVQYEGDFTIATKRGGTSIVQRIGAVIGKCELRTHYGLVSHRNQGGTFEFNAACHQMSLSQSSGIL